jgi:hypothetical protein
MLNRTRLFFAALVACGGALVPVIAAQAQDAITNQAYAQMNQVQQQLSSGLINSTQAADLMNRYSDVIRKDQQYTMQDGGSLNLPDRLDLQGKLRGDSKRLVNDMKSNGVNVANSGGLLSGLFGSYSGVPVGGTLMNSVPLTNGLTTMPLANGLTGMPLANGLTGMPLANGLTSVLPITNGLSSTMPYVAPVSATTPYLNTLGTMPYAATGYGANYLNPYATSAYGTSPYNNSLYNANPYGSSYGSNYGYRRYRGY